MADGALHWPRLRRRGWLVAGTGALAAAAVAAAA
jgi:hypothetical protein